MSDEPRCQDCLEPFAPGARRFAVLKQMRDVPEYVSDDDHERFEAMCMDHVDVCEDCSGWYSDAIERD